MKNEDKVNPPAAGAWPSPRHVRLDLEKAHPLPFPLAIWIEPTNVCNFKCSFCPESLPDYGKQAGYYQHMPMELFAKIVRDMHDASWRPKVIRFFHEGEPLLNRNLPAMIQAVQGALTDRTEVASNGTQLALSAPAVIASGLTYLRVSIYATTDREMGAVSKSSLYFPHSIAAGVRSLCDLRENGRPFIHAKLMIPDATCEQIGRFRQTYRFCDQVDTMAEVHNWGGSLVQIGQQPPGERKVCPMPFYTLAIKANGLVTVCCADWQNELAVGDVSKQSLKEIWGGPKLGAIQDAHWSGHREIFPACRNCTSFYDYPDNLEGHLHKIENVE